MAIITGPETPPITIASAPGRSTVRVRPPESISVPTDGTGELSSQFPGALTTVEGVPVSAQVLVRYRAPEPGGYGDGVLVATTTSSPAGEWEVQGINAKHRYDISARLIGENDALQSNVSPFDLPRFRPNTVQVPIGVPLDMPLPIVGGKGEVAVVHVSGSYPAGVSLVDGRLVGSWPTGATGSYPLVFNLTDDVGTATGTLGVNLVLLPMSLSPSALPELLAVGTPVSVPFSASGGEGPYTYSVSAGSLPSGTSLDPVTGVWSGTPDTEDEYSFTIKATGVRGSAETEYTVEARAADPHYSSVIVLLPLDIDLEEKKYGLSVTGHNSPSFDPLDGPFPGVGSIYLGGRSVQQCIEVAYSANSDLGDDDFTIEAWFKFISHPTAGQYAGWISRRRGAADQQAVYLEAAGPSSINIRAAKTSSSSDAVMDSTLPATNEWVHIALTRDANTWRYFEAGTHKASATYSGSLYATPVGWMIGHSNTPRAGTNYLDAKVSNVRVTKGVARYTADFAPPTKPFPNF